jgi:cysteine desulfurase
MVTVVAIGEVSPVIARAAHRTADLPCRSMRAYLDHASTTPLRPAARLAMVEWLERHDGRDRGAREAARVHEAGDPSRLHAEGLGARVALEEARGRVAHALGARPREVVFTSGATESIAMACFGAAEGRGRHSVLPAVEHSAVREWAARGEQTVVGVDRVGRVDPAELAAGVRPDTGLVHCQWGNHEVGTLQPFTAVVQAVDHRALVHVDAAQAVGRTPVEFVESGVDLMSVSSHKLGGPVGVGVLLVRRGLRLPPLLVGGDQERARRAGTENVLGIVGFTAALEDAVAELAAEPEREFRLTSLIVDWANDTEGVRVLGDPIGRLPHLVCLGLDGIEPQPVLLGLDALGIAVHSGSSCSSEALEPSPVLEAMGVDADRSLRISVGWTTTLDEVHRCLDALVAVLEELRGLRRSL